MSICPVCNGMAALESPCPNCSGTMSDQGRVSDFYAPYSPYREFDDVAMSNGYPDVQLHQCLHFTYCPTCQFEAIIHVQEQ